MEWWAKTSEDVIKDLNTSPEGLNEEVVKERLATYGPNDIPKRIEKSASSLFISQFKDPFY